MNNLDRYLVDDYICLDIETTGFKPIEGSEMTEIAGAWIKDGNVIETYSSLIKTKKSIPENITELTGINDDMVKHANTLETVFLNFVDVFDLTDRRANIVVHNVKFDIPFLTFYTDKIFGELYLSNVWYDNDFICSLELARLILPNQSHKLDYLKKQFGVNTRGHRALNDVLSTVKIYEELKKIATSCNNNK